MKKELFERISEEKLSAYLEGTLDEKQAAEVDALLDSDIEFQRLVDEYVAVQMAVNCVEEERRDENAMVNIAAVRLIKRAMRRKRSMVKWAVVAACCAAVFVVGVMVFMPQFDYVEESGAGAIEQNCYEKGIYYNVKEKGCEPADVDSLDEVMEDSTKALTAD